MAGVKLKSKRETMIAIVSLGMWDNNSIYNCDDAYVQEYVLTTLLLDHTKIKDAVIKFLIPLKEIMQLYKIGNESRVRPTARGLVKDYLRSMEMINDG
jgi:hypothetical protein